MTTTSKRFYRSYLESFIDFLVPKGSRVLRDGFKSISKTETYDYAVLSDVLGHTHDIQEFLEEIKKSLKPQGRVVITQYNIVWEPILRIASRLGLRNPSTEKNWLSMLDLKNFVSLSGFEVVKSGSKMLVPVYIPIVSWICNAYIANIFPFSKLGMFHYVVARLQTPYTKRDVQNPSVSIVVPARNEAGTIQRIVDELPVLGAYTEIVFIEGHSKDNTWEVVQQVTGAYRGPKKILCARQDGKGKGDAVRKGFDMSTGDILMIYDADMTVPAQDVRKFYDTLISQKADFANGSRLVYPLEKQSMRIANFFANKFFSFMFSTILGQPMKDTLCGTKVLWKTDYASIQAGRDFFGDFDPFGDFDLLFGAAKLNLKIVDVPIHYKERVYGETNIQRWSHGWLLLKMTVFAARKIKFI